MKKIITLITIILCVTTVNAQGYSRAHYHYTQKDTCESFKENNINININQLELSGTYLEKSAKFQYASICTAIATPAIIGIIEKTRQDAKKRYAKVDDKAFNNAEIIVGVVGGLTCLSLELVSINYKMKSGKSLRLSATHITYNF